MHEQPGDMLSHACSSCARHLVIAAPYIKADALSRILANVSPVVSLICITRWNPNDLAVGVSDTECRTISKARGGSFRLHPSLHAKYYRIDDVVLIGSANLTSAAMGWSRQPNLEILCRPGDDFNVDIFQQYLFEGAREINDDEFTRWQSISKIDIQETRKIASDISWLDTWRPVTRDPRHLELIYRNREDAIASIDEQRAAKGDIQALQIPSDLTDEELRIWITACFLAAPFINTVIRLHAMETASTVHSLASTYNLSATEARRDMETVQNWLAFLSPDILSEDS